MTSNKSKTSFTTIAFLIVAVWTQTYAVPAENPSSIKDDFTTEWAQQIIRISKAADINATLNTNVDPCDNFYQFACGNWHRHNPAQLLKNIITDKFQMLAKAFDRRLERMSNEALSTNELENKVRDFYQSCKVVQKDAAIYTLALEKVYKEFGELPVLAGEQWDESTFYWWEIIAKIQHKYGRQIILAVDIMGDVKNNTVTSVYLRPADLKKIGAKTKILSVLQETTTVRDLQKYLGVEHALAKTTAKEMIEFERALEQGRSNGRAEEGLSALLTYKKVNAFKAPIKNFLDVVFEAQGPESIYVYDEKYLSNMEETIATRPKRILANYILWQLMQEYLIDASETDISRFCTERTKKYFGKFVDHQIYARYKSAQAEEEVLQMWQEIRATFRDNLSGNKLDWISNATRQYALEKLDAMSLQINSYDNENFTAEYANLQIKPDEYVMNVQQILMHESRKQLAKLQAPPTALEATDIFSFTPAYDKMANLIKIPVALLQPRYFWDANYPHAIKYATLGTLIAHEMIHGFDDDGRIYDKHGNEQPWWDPKSTYEFEERRKCFQAQYHSYKYAGSQLPERVSQSENIADNAGVKLAYAAYMRWLQSKAAAVGDIEKLETLPGLKFDNKQLFFVNYAQVWCDDVHSFFKSSMATSDSHAPGIYRVIGSLSNFQEFSWVFQCKQDAAMDPEYKCAVY